MIKFASACGSPLNQFQAQTHLLQMAEQLRKGQESWSWDQEKNSLTSDITNFQDGNEVRNLQRKLQHVKVRLLNEKVQIDEFKAQSELNEYCDVEFWQSQNSELMLCQSSL